MKGDDSKMNLRDISSASTERLAELNRDSSWWTSLSRGDHHVEVLTELGDSREPGLVPSLIYFALSSRNEARRAARRAIAKLIACVPVARLAEFDGIARESAFHWGFGERWRTISPAAVAEFVSEDDRGILAFASMHANGRVREAALRTLAAQSDGRELPFLLLRANDWVEPIREHVRAWISSRLTSGHAAAFLTCLPIVLRLELSGRADLGWLSKSVGSLLARSECRAVLREGLDSEDREVRRACLRFIDAADPLASRPALFAALDDHDSLIRLWAVRRLFDILDSDGRMALCDRLERDHFMPIRREVLNARILHGGDQLSGVLLTALLDRHASIRDLARFHLKDRLDIAQFYRDAIAASGASVIIAIRGLGESGSKTDADVVAPFLTSRTAKLRKAAVVSIGRLDVRRFEEELRSALSDNVAGVSAAACAALEPLIPSKIDVRPFVEMLAPESAVFVRKNALRLVTRFARWIRIPFLLSACRDPSPEIGALAAAAVRSWLRSYNRDFITPTAAQIAAGIQELRQSQEFLDSRTAKELAAIFQGVNT